MKKKFPILFIGLLSCLNQPKDKSKAQASNPVIITDSSYVWKKLSDSADWKKSYNFQMFSIRDTLWTFHPDGNWFSVNGVNWIKSSLPNSIYNLAFLDYVQFKEALYGLGHFEGNIETFKLRNVVYKTTDLREWETFTETNLPKRFFYHPFEFQNKLWIIGGEDKDKKYSDIWNSENGIKWTMQKENLPFGYSNGGQFLIFKNKLYMFRSDVWSSPDGLHWEQLTPAIIPGEEIFGYAPVVFDEKIWLLGCNRNEQFTSQVLVSGDGKNWRTQDAPWSPRGGIAATVHKGKIYMTGGKYGGTPNHPDFRYDNDIWTLERK
jgi:hypothetical protein